MQEFIKKHFFFLLFFQGKFFETFFKNSPFFQQSFLGSLLKKYSSHFLIILALIFLSLISDFLPLIWKEKPEAQSLDALVPKDFVFASHRNW